MLPPRILALIALGAAATAGLVIWLIDFTNNRQATGYWPLVVVACALLIVGLNLFGPKKR